MSLLDSLQEHHGEKVAMIIDEPITYAQLIEQAQDVRHEFSHYKRKAVGITYTHLKDYVAALIAFDEFCDSLYLLPDRQTLPDCMSNSSSLMVWPEDEVVDFEASLLRDSSTDTKWFIATSGTTAEPKWIEHKFDGLSAHVRQSERMRELRWGLLYQPFRFAGLQVLLQALISGACLIDCLTESITEKVTLVERHKVSALSATPGLWRQFLMESRFYSLSLSHLTLGGEIADQALLNALNKAFPEASIKHIYASTEAGVGFVVSDKKAGFPVDWLDNEDFPAPMFVDQQQHLWIKSTFASQMVCNDSRREGYMDTQDIVEVVSDRVFFLGRASGVINIGGNKAHPERIEQVMLDVDGVSGVQVYGKGNSVLGQLVHAKVVLSGQHAPLQVKKAIIQHCKSRLQKYEIPVTIKFVDALAMTSAGKIKRESNNA